MMVGQKGQFLSRFTVAEGVDLLKGAASGSSQLRLCAEVRPQPLPALLLRSRLVAYPVVPASHN